MAVGFLLPHDASIAKKDFMDYICSIDELEKETGIDFFPNSEDLSPKTPCPLGKGCLSLGRGLLTKGWGISSGEKLPWADPR